MNVSDEVFADFTFRVLNLSSKGKSRKVNNRKNQNILEHRTPDGWHSTQSYGPKEM
mgnify:CR=1 FL=1